MKSEMKYVAMFSTLTIIVGSIVPLPNTPSGEETRMVAHTIACIICSFSWARLLKSKRRYLLLMIALVPLTEILQLPLPYRNPSIEDLIANIAGSITGFFLFHICNIVGIPDSHIISYS